MTWPSKGFQVMQSAFYNPSSVNNDYFQGEHLNNVIQALRGNKIISGLEVTEQAIPSLTVDIAAGSCYVAGVERTYSATTMDLTAHVPPLAGDSRYVIIQINSAGTLEANLGTIANTGDQIIPEIQEDSVVLAVIILTNGDTTINTVDIGDMRIFTAQNTWVQNDLIVGNQIISKKTTGAPIVVASNTLVTNLNADLLDGQEGSYYATATHNHDGIYQPLDTNLTTIAALAPTQDYFMVGGASDWIQISPATARSILGLNIGSDVQAYDADLAAIAGFTHADGNIMVSNGLAWVLESGSVARASLGLAIGSDVQAYSAYLSTLAGLNKADGNFVVTNGTTFVVENGATARTSLGLGSIATQSAAAIAITGGSLANVSVDLKQNNLSFEISATNYNLTPTILKYLYDIQATGVTPTEFDYLDGVTSNIQTQLNSKAASSHGTHVTISWQDINGATGSVNPGGTIPGTNNTKYYINGTGWSSTESGYSFKVVASSPSLWEKIAFAGDVYKMQVSVSSGILQGIETWMKWTWNSGGTWSSWVRITNTSRFDLPEILGDDITGEIWVRIKIVDLADGGYIDLGTCTGYLMAQNVNA